ncbi:MAG TPA: GNAT family N-acetyltransferase [Candidatus Cybelea sp.]|nr:GNAT family N-acetyltransferase [Candidatus Cybelea sp.]
MAIFDAGAVSIRALGSGDIAAAAALNAAAGWNQIDADWRIMLDLGCGFAVDGADGALAATAIALPYDGAFGWISMVLVASGHRRRGLASALVNRCIDTLRGADLTPVLDATPAGRDVYRGLGFRDLWAMRRLAGEAFADPVTHPAGITFRAAVPADLPALGAYDAPVFGADRTALLAHLRERLPQAAVVAERAGRIAGFALGRDGRRANQVGPVAADDAGVAVALLARSLGALKGPVYVDVADRHTSVAAWLEAHGFRSERPLTRMALARDRAFDDPNRLFAVAGPELG